MVKLTGRAIKPHISKFADLICLMLIAYPLIKDTFFGCYLNVDYCSLALMSIFHAPKKHALGLDPWVGTGFRISVWIKMKNQNKMFQREEQK